MDDESAKQFRSVVASWKENRALFPGWLIAPHRIRDHLWMYTRFWIPEIIRVLPDLPLEERLLALEELSWRLETALIPLWSDVAQVVVECLESINPFPAEMTLPHAKLILNKENHERKGPGWHQVRKAWIDLAFGILRLHREERQSADFERWAERLNGVAASSDELIARLLYERCLYALGEMDDLTVRELLKQWPDSAIDVVWVMRKAGLLAELGAERSNNAD